MSWADQNYVLIILCDPAKREANSSNFISITLFAIALGHTTFNGKNERKEKGGPKLEYTSLNH